MSHHADRDDALLALPPGHTGIRDPLLDRFRDQDGSFIADATVPVFKSLNEGSDGIDLIEFLFLYSDKILFAGQHQGLQLAGLFISGRLARN